jgi:hypothetical protein
MNHGLGRPPGVSGSSRHCDQEGNREKTVRKFVMPLFLRVPFYSAVRKFVMSPFPPSNKLSELHHSIFFIEHIVGLPFDLFVHPAQDLFLRMTLDNLAQVAILQITKLTTDNGRDARTLNKFRNVMDRSVKDDYRADYRKLLGGVRFKPRIDALIDKAKDLRDLQIAHSVSEEVDAITFAEIKEIVHELTKLFEVASFDMEYWYLIFCYDPNVRCPVGTDPRPDIERILDGIARDSPVLHLPKSTPMAWPYARQGWSEKKIEQFNHYRRKCGLPEV